MRPPRISRDRDRGSYRTSLNSTRTRDYVAIFQDKPPRYRNFLLFVFIASHGIEREGTAGKRLLDHLTGDLFSDINSWTIFRKRYRVIARVGTLRFILLKKNGGSGTTLARVAP